MGPVFHRNRPQTGTTNCVVKIFLEASWPVTHDKKTKMNHVGGTLRKLKHLLTVTFLLLV